MAVVTTNLGTVTAYGDAVAAGYTGTKAQWQALMADYATVGQQAAQSAQTASTAATTASTAAQTATTKASEASASATAAAASAASINTPDTTLTQSGKAADAKATGDEISQIKEDFTDMVNSAYVTDSASGSVAHFTDGADNIPMKSVKVNIAPVQSGSGDPSPDNIRPISGWSSIKITRTGKNVLMPPTVSTTTHNGITFTYMPDGGIKCNGTSTGVAYSSRQSNFRLQVGQYTKNPQDTNGVGVIVQTMTTPDWTSVQGGGVADRTVVIKEEDAKYTFAVRVRVPSGITLTNYVIYRMLRHVSDTDDAYEPYNGNTYTVNLSSAGTVYGGTLDVVSGELTVDREYVPMTAELWKAWNDSAKAAYTDGVYQNREIMACDSLKAGELVTNGIKVRTTDGRIGALPQWAESCTTIAEFKTALANNPAINIVITLATPLTYQLTATEIKSLLGINNVWSDAGDMDVEYRADTKLYIDKKLGV